jgi:hypothetical protein
MSCLQVRNSKWDTLAAAVAVERRDYGLPLQAACIARAAAAHDVEEGDVVEVVSRAQRRWLADSRGVLHGPSNAAEVQTAAVDRLAPTQADMGLDPDALE